MTAVDFLLWTHPQHFWRSYADDYGYTRYLNLLRGCHRIIFVSESTHDIFLGRIARWWPGRGALIYPGSDGIHGKRRPHPQASLSRLPRGTIWKILILGTIEPRRHSIDVLHACQSFARANRAKVRLTFIGQVSALWGESLGHVIDEIRSSNGVLWLGDATDDAVRDALTDAHVLIYVTDGEGFGAPPLEALRHGVPVISSAGVPSVDQIEEPAVHKINGVEHDLPQALRKVLNTATWPLASRAASDIRLPTWHEYVTHVLAFFGVNAQEDRRREVSRDQVVDDRMIDDLELLGHAFAGGAGQFILETARYFLSREPSVEEFEHHLDSLRGGSSAVNVALSFATCDEAIAKWIHRKDELAQMTDLLRRAEPYSRLLFGSPETESTEQFVQRCFQELLHRPAHVSDIVEYGTAIRNGLARREAAMAIAVSREHLVNVADVEILEIATAIVMRDPTRSFDA
jgi:hypothetical protein